MITDLLQRSASLLHELRRYGACNSIFGDRMVSLEMELRAALKDIEHRAPQPAPTAPGWYYGRPTGAVGSDREIEPIRVISWRGKGLRTYEYEDNEPLDQFDWFGPVPQIVEAPR